MKTGLVVERMERGDFPLFGTFLLVQVLDGFNEGKPSDDQEVTAMASAPCMCMEKLQILTWL